MKGKTIFLTLGMLISFSSLGSGESHFEKGLIAYEKGDLTLARDYFTSTVTASPKALIPKRYLADVHVQLEDWTKAAGLYREILAMRPKDNNAHLGLGVCQYHMQDYAAADTSFNRVLEHNPENAVARRYLALTTRQQLQAQQGSKSALTMDIWVGLEYDDNVTVSETDSNSGKGDEALIIDLAAEYDLADYQDWEMTAGYDLYQSHFQDLDAFNLSSHGLWSSAEREIEGWDISGQLSLGYASLDGDKLYRSHGLRPGIGRQWTRQWYSTAYLDWQDRDFEDSRRDGDQTLMGVDGIWFVDEGQESYAVLSLALDEDDTDGDEFDYRGVRLGGAWHFPLDLQGYTLKAIVSYRLEDRDYDHVTSSIGEKRDDERQSLKASAEYQINTDWRIKASYEYIDSDSNLPSTDYREHTFNVSAGLRF